MYTYMYLEYLYTVPWVEASTLASSPRTGFAEEVGGGTPLQISRLGGWTRTRDYQWVWHVMTAPSPPKPFRLLTTALFCCPTSQPPLYRLSFSLTAS